MNNYSQYLESTPFDYWQLLKPRVVSLVIFTSFVGMIISPGKIHPIIGFCAILCIALGAGASGCLNMWWEHKIDSLMLRTQDRPIPQKKIHPSSALAFGIFLSFFSVILMMVSVNYQASFLLAFTIFFYVVIYTIYLKPRTKQNIVIGGLSGAMPPVIGWACKTDIFSPFPWIMCAIIFFWTPAHFWSLSLQLKEDYKQSNLPMLPNIVGDKKTLHMIFFYTIITVIITFVPYYLKLTGPIYLWGVLIGGIYFIFQALQLMLITNNPMCFFFQSIYYLFFIFLLTLFDFLFNNYS